MRKFLTFLIALAAIAFAVCSPSSAQVGGLMFPGPGSFASSGGGALTFAQTDSDKNTSTPAPGFTFTTKNVGTGSATRFVWVALDFQGTNSPNMDITTVQVNVGGGNVTLNRDVYARTVAVGHGIWSGLITGGGSSTATITVSGYTNGYVNAVFMQCGTITGSATATSTGPLTSTGYPASTFGSLTVPTNGIAIVTGLDASAMGALKPTNKNLSAEVDPPLP
jgi:hypothetical protein